MSFGHKYRSQSRWWGDLCEECNKSPANSCHWHEFRPKLLWPDECVRCGNPADSRWHGAKEREEVKALTCDELQKLLGPGFEVLETPDKSRPFSRVRFEHPNQLREVAVWTAEFTDLVVDAIRQNPECNRFEMIMVLADQISGHDEPEPVDVRSKSPAERLEDLTEWWMATSTADLNMGSGKAVIYGSNSLEQLGRTIAQLQGGEVTDEEAQELGCWINVVQKMGRWTDAVMRGERPQDDTLVDLIVYAMMARRIRHSGGWPDGQK